MRIHWCVFLLLGAVATSAQQEAPPRPCQSEQARQFDFWLGQWNVSWGDDSQGTNSVTAELDGCVIVERFDGQPGTPLVGMSVASFDAHSGMWKQTWVDNQGGYLDFTGTWQQDRMILRRQASRDGVDFLQRMVWYDIAEDHFQWHWERSDDDGKTWQVLWHIRYVRDDPPDAQ